MLRLLTSYSAKCPGSEPYSSEGYSASIELELPSMSAEQLKKKLHDGFNLVRESVEAELHGIAVHSTQVVQPPQQLPAHAEPKPTSKQLNYAGKLLARHDAPTAEILARYGVTELAQLSKSTCSQLIEDLSANRQTA